MWAILLELIGGLTEGLGVILETVRHIRISCGSATRALEGPGVIVEMVAVVTEIV